MPSILQSVITDPTEPAVNITFLLDVSGSMIDEPINQLNVAMSDAVAIAEEAGIRLEAKVYMRVIKFESTASWHIGNKDRGETHIDWKPLVTGGGTDTAGAIKLARSIMTTNILGTTNYQPVVILITDGQSNNPSETAKEAAALKKSLKNSAGDERIMCISIGVKGAVRSELEAFATVGTIVENGVTRENVPFVFEVDDIETLRNLITSVTRSSIISSTSSNASAGSGTPTPPPVITVDPTGGNTSSAWPSDIVGEITDSQLVP